MSIGYAIALYFLIWWTVLFVIVPIGVRTQEEDGEIVPGTPESAPIFPHLGAKAIYTTILSTMIFALVYAVLVHHLIRLDNIPFLPRYDQMN